jgi:hypothetical protein
MNSSGGSAALLRQPLESIAATAYHGLIFRPAAPSTAIDEQLAGWRRAVRQVLAGLSEESIARASKCSFSRAHDAP